MKPVWIAIGLLLAGCSSPSGSRDLSAQTSGSPAVDPGFPVHGWRPINCSASQLVAPSMHSCYRMDEPHGAACVFPHFSSYASSPAAQEYVHAYIPSGPFFCWTAPNNTVLRRLHSEVAYFSPNIHDWGEVTDSGSTSLVTFGIGARKCIAFEQWAPLQAGKAGLDPRSPYNFRGYVCGSADGGPISPTDVKEYVSGIQLLDPDGARLR
jgi:hypothetical protein